MQLVLLVVLILVAVQRKVLCAPAQRGPSLFKVSVLTRATTHVEQRFLPCGKSAGLYLVRQCARWLAQRPTGTEHHSLRVCGIASFALCERRGPITCVQRLPAPPDGPALQHPAPHAVHARQHLQVHRAGRRPRLPRRRHPVLPRQRPAVRRAARPLAEAQARAAACAVHRHRRRRCPLAADRLWPWLDRGQQRPHHCLANLRGR